MFLRNKILKRGASKAVFTRFKLNINAINIACFVLGSITSCLITIWCCYLLAIDFTKTKNYIAVEQPEVQTTDNQNNQPATPKFKFYYYLPKNHTEKNITNKQDYSVINYEQKTNHAVVNKNTTNNNTVIKATTKQTVYYLQIGIFKNLKQAQRIVSKIECLGFVSVIEKIKFNTQKDWFRVEIGPFFNLEEIDKAQNKISNQDINNTLFQYRKKIMH
jgi:cell division protein FtsN